MKQPPLTLRVILAKAALILVSCATGSDSSIESERVDSIEQPIQDGKVEPGASYTVGICVGSGPGACLYQCSGSLIAPNLVLTTRHCLEGKGFRDRIIDCATARFGEHLPAEKLWVTVNADVTRADGGWYQAAEEVTPAGTAFCGQDIALLILQKLVPDNLASGIAPRVIADPLHPQLGTEITVIGFGATAFFGKDIGIRHLRSNILISCVPGSRDLDCPELVGTTLMNNEFRAGNGLCPGDSGAPALDPQSYRDLKPVVIGVLSRASNSENDCVNAIFARTDRWGPLIAKTASRAAILGGYPLPDWANKPELLDPAPLGEACRNGADCASRTCASNDGALHYRCTQACPCPEGFACAEGEQPLCFPKEEIAEKPTSARRPSESCAMLATGMPTEGGALALALGVLLSLRRRRPRN